jgi:putative transposase
MSTKSDIIKESLKQTLQRRKSQDCRVYELKLDLSHLSNKKLNDLRLLFLESKWLYNHILSKNNLANFDAKNNYVSILDKDKQPVAKELKIIGSQIKQSIYTRIIDSIKALSVLKENGHKVGGLKFKSEIKSIPLKQYGTTYRFNKTKPNYIKIQNIKGYFKVNGIKQIPKNVEFANATLINKNNNFYLALTCFIQKKTKSFPQKEIGIDFGIESAITLSNGEKFKVNIPENKRSRKLRQKLSRKQGSKKNSKKSKSYLKNLELLNKSINKTTNQKKDAKNKIVSKIVNVYETICVQDENIKQWQEDFFGKQVYNSVLGGIMRDLKRKSHTFKMVDKYIPTTQLCPSCFRLNKFGLEQREYKCKCGYAKDRDTHSAQNILEIGMGRLDISKVLAEHKHYKSPMEGMTSAESGKSIPRKLEAHELICG